MQKKLMAAAVAGRSLRRQPRSRRASTVQIYGAEYYEYGVADQGHGRPNVDYADTPGANASVSAAKKNSAAICRHGSSAKARPTSAAWTRPACASRNSAVGFKGGFGNVFFGRWDTPFKRAMNVGTVGAEETGILGMSFLPFGGSGGADDLSDGNRARSGETPQRQRFKRREAGLSLLREPDVRRLPGDGRLLTGNGAADNDAGGGVAGAIDGTANSHARIWSVGATLHRRPSGYRRRLREAPGLRRQLPALTGVPPDSRRPRLGRLRRLHVRRQHQGRRHVPRPEVGNRDRRTLKKRRLTLGVDWAIVGPHSLQAQWTHALDDSKGNGTGIGGNGGATRQSRSVGGVGQQSAIPAAMLLDRLQLRLLQAHARQGRATCGSRTTSNTSRIRIGNSRGACGGNLSAKAWTATGSTSSTASKNKTRGTLKTGASAPVFFAVPVTLF